MNPIFTVDLEDFHHGLHIEPNGHSSIEAAWWLRDILKHYGVRGIIYVLGSFSKEQPLLISALASDGHHLQSHGIYHIRGERADRQPYAYLGPCGGFYFRLFPYWLIKRQVIKAGQLYLHPHDLDEQHPRIPGFLMNLKRHIGLKGARAKLERLLQEVRFANP